METTRANSSSTEGSQPSLHLVQQQSGVKRDNPPYNSRFDSVGGRGGSRNQRGGRGGRGFGRGGAGNKIICQLCEKPGHSAAKCWHRFEHNYTPPQVQFRGNQSQQQQQNFLNPSAHMVQSVPRTPTANFSVGNQSEFAYDSSASTSWYPDSGATHHVSNDLSNLNISSEYTGSKSLVLGNGEFVAIANIGESVLNSHSSTFSRKLHLKKLLHVPNITKNLLSVSQFAKDNSVFFEFHPSFCLVKDLCSKEIVLKGTLEKGLYHFLVDHSPIKRSNSSKLFISSQEVPAVHSATLPKSTSSSSSNSVSSLDIALWHNRLGHPTLDVVKNALNSCNIPFVSMNDQSICHPCSVSKAHRLPYSLSTSVSAAPLEIIHSDLWGPSPVLSRNGFSYYVSFIDHYSRFTWIYLLKHKSDVCAVFKQFKSMSENLLNSKIKHFQSDWGGEFQGLTAFFKDCGISHRISCPYTPQQNGLAERKHRHIVETGLALLAQASLPQSFWDDAFLTAVHLINRMPSKIIKNISPFEKLHSLKPDYSSLRVFGCLCYPFIRPYNKHKLDYRSVRATFLGYSPSHKGFKALLPNGKVIVTRDIIFDEFSFPFQSQSLVSNQQSSVQSGSPASFLPLQDQHLSAHPPPPSSPPSSTHPISSHQETPVPSSPVSVAQHNSPTDHSSSHSDSPNVPSDSSIPISSSQPQPTHHMTTRSKAGIFKPKIFSLAITPSVTPRSASEALLIPVWKAAMLTEFLALLKNNTWILTTLPSGKNSHWLHLGF